MHVQLLGSQLPDYTLMYTTSNVYSDQCISFIVYEHMRRRRDAAISGIRA
jgi:hypothetical protein